MKTTFSILVLLIAFLPTNAQTKNQPIPKASDQKVFMACKTTSITPAPGFWKQELNTKDDFNLKDALIAQTTIDSFVVFNFYSEKDSVPFYKYSSQYKDINSEIIYLEYYWDGLTNAWINNKKEEFREDPSGRTNYIAEYNWDKIKNIWVGSLHNENTYEGNTNNGKSIQFLWDTIQNNWVNGYLTEYKYNELWQIIYYNNYKWNPDSSTWLPYYIHEIFYDEDWHITKEWNQQLTYKENQLSGGTKHEKFYKDSKLIKEEVKGWNNTTGEWKSNQIDTFMYDGNITTKEHKWWNYYSEIWQLQYTEKSTNNEFGSPDSTIRYDISNSILRPLSRITYLYDERGNCILQNYYNWKNDSWALSGIRENGYDEKNNETLLSTYYFRNDSLIGDNKHVNGYFYYGTNNRNNTLIEEYNWDDGKNDWKGSGTKYQATYFPDGRKETETYSEWDTDSWDWIPSRNIEYNYNQYNRTLQISRYSWNPGSNEWLPSEIEEYFYGGEPNSLVIKTLSSWDELNEKWILKQKTYYYRNTITHSDPIQSGIKIYPNPASDYLNILGLNQPATLEIYSIDGKLVTAKSLTQNRVNLSNIPKGIYLIKLINAGEILKTQKIVIQ